MLTPHTKHKPPRIPTVRLNPLLIFPIICYLPKFKREDIDSAGYSREPLPKSILIGFFVLCEKYCVVFECIFNTRLSKSSLQLHAQS